MVLPGTVAAKISYPVTNVLSQLESLVMPQGYGLAAPGDGSASSYATVLPARRNFKPFIVGLIPPDVPVDFIPFKRSPGTSFGIEESQTPTVPNGTGGPGGTTRQTLGKQFWINYVYMCDRLKLDPNDVAKVWFSESGLIPSQIAFRDGRPIAKGLNQLTRTSGAAVGLTSDQWDSYDSLSGTEQLPYIENFMNRTGQRGGKTAEQLYASNFGGFNLPGYGPCYMSQSTFASLPADQQASISKICGPRLGFMFKAYDQNAGLEKGRGVVGAAEVGSNVSKLHLPSDVVQNILNARQSVDGGVPEITGASLTAPPDPVIAADETNNRHIMSYGSSTQLESDPSGDRIGKFVQYDPDRAQVVERQKSALIRQIETIRSVPGLLLMVNPSEFTRSFEPTVDTSVKGRYGNIVHTWLEKPTELSCSGVTAGQYVVAPDGSGGITGELRCFSASYQNLLSLLTIYKANGIIRGGSELDHGIAQLGYSVFIYFDNFIYVGSFESFEIQDEDTRPHNMSYSFRFTVRYCFDVGNDGRFTDFEVGVRTGFFPQVSV